MDIMTLGSIRADAGAVIHIGVQGGAGITLGTMVMQDITTHGMTHGMLVTAILMRMATMDMAGEVRTIIADTTVGQAILCGMFIEQVTRVR